MTPETVNIKRHARQLLLLGLPNQIKICQAKVLVIGAGGLGSPCLNYLVMSGVGNLINRV